MVRPGLRAFGVRFERPRPGPARPRNERTATDRARIVPVVIFFEVLLALASLLIVWFAVYVVYRLVTDE